MNRFHNNRDEYILDGELKKLKDDVFWSTSRQQKLKRKLLNNIETNTTIRKKSPLLSASIKAAFTGICLVSITSFLIFFTVLDVKNINNVELETSNEMKYPYEIKTDLYAEINRINDSGFKLVLPTVSLSEDMILTNIKQRNVDSRVEVTSFYQFEGHKEFLIQQDAIEPSLKPQYEKRFNEIKLSATESFFIHDFPAYVVESSNDTTIYVLTDNYSYFIYSRDLNVERLKFLFNSMSIN